MKVTVTKYLNVRVGKASVNAPSYQYLAPGTILEVEDKTYKGDKYEDKDDWLKDAAGNYYWIGGVDYPEPANQVTSAGPEKWWLTNFGIKEIWASGYTGLGVKIAILDTGISYPHTDLSLDKTLFTDVTKSASGIDDKIGHGTHCAGIIKASNNEFGSTGIAYNSTLYICKTTHDQYGDKDEYILQGIKWAIGQNVDIISISKGQPMEGEGIHQAIMDANAQGILIVAAAGNLTPGFPDNHIFFPARYPETLSVGGTDENNKPLHDAILTNETNIYAPGKEIPSTFINNSYASLSGSSQATPYVAAACALLLEFKRNTDPHFPANEIKGLILKNATNANVGKLINLANLFD
jgi:subtilisin family serine protease